MPLTSAQQAAVNRLASYYEGQNAYNAATNPGGFKQGGHLINFVPALQDVAAAILGASGLVNDAVAAAANSPKALRVDSAQSFSAAEVTQGIANLDLDRALRGDVAQTFTDAEAAQLLSNLRKALRFDAAQTLTDTERGRVLTSLLYALRADAAQSFTPAQQAQLAANLGLVMPPVAQCRVEFTSSTVVTLKPVGGGYLWDGSKSRPLPSGGITLSNSGLLATSLPPSTTYLPYYLYAKWVSNAWTFFASTTGYTIDVVTGFGLKSDDSAAIVVGMVALDGTPGSQGTFADTPAKRYVASWFNRRDRDLLGATSSGQTATTNAEVNSAGRIAFLALAGEAIQAGVLGGGSASANDNLYFLIGVDGLTGSPQSNFVSPANGQASPLAARYDATLSDGLHYATLVGRSGGSTFNASFTMNGRTRL